MTHSGSAMSTSPRDAHDALDRAIFLGKAAETLSTLIAGQVEAVFQDAGIEVPVRSCSLLDALHEAQALSAAEIARTLGQSHQVIIQKLPRLLELRLIRKKADPKDGRRSVLSLTAKGKAQLQRLRDLSPNLRAAYDELNAELGVDLLATIEAASESLRSNSLSKRL